VASDPAARLAVLPNQYNEQYKDDIQRLRMSPSAAFSDVMGTITIDASTAPYPELTNALGYMQTATQHFNRAFEDLMSLIEGLNPKP
jgi:hypothetical protein